MIAEGDPLAGLERELAFQPVAGSHRQGVLPYEMVDKQKAGHVLSKRILEPERDGEAVSLPLTAGELSIHSHMLAHSSELNPSQRRRCGLTLRYCPASVHAVNQANERAVVVLGAEHDGRWHNLLCPDDSFDLEVAADS
jgi:ectoine hydroxylase-related dioxygenase (phytanoyl-CoA dioxygenase family)